MTIIFAAGCCPLSGCAVAIGIDKAPDEIWEKLATGEQQDLIVEFNDSDVRTEAAQFSKARGIIFDDGETIRFKAQHIISPRLNRKLCRQYLQGSLKYFGVMTSCP
ncbi:MAG: hypothetical protein NT083_14125 [Rhodocyclales bacterium]|nr:hypothetical protein [Rhodocyclales bacterium]